MAKKKTIKKGKRQTSEFTSGTSKAFKDIDKALANLRRKIRKI